MLSFHRVCSQAADRQSPSPGQGGPGKGHPHPDCLQQGAHGSQKRGLRDGGRLADVQVNLRSVCFCNFAIVCVIILKQTLYCIPKELIRLCKQPSLLPLVHLVHFNDLNL